jgi:hypothetical protein
MACAPAHGAQVEDRRRVMRRRRICWPTPDSVCLQGGCLWCNDYPFRTLREVRQYAFANDMLAALNYGERQFFLNTEYADEW